MPTKYLSPATIEQMAETIRADFPDAVSKDGIGEVDILRIAEGLGCSVQEVDFTIPNVFARVERQWNGESKLPKQYIIQVARKDSAGRQNFSIAHEIAHIVLHDDGKSEFIERRQALVDYNEKELYKETQANMLAAALLMPKAQVEILWQQTRDIEDLAAAYNVSVEAAYNRVLNLGLMADE